MPLAAHSCGGPVAGEDVTPPTVITAAVILLDVAMMNVTRPRGSAAWTDTVAAKMEAS